jgi:hypothetical protein
MHACIVCSINDDNGKALHAPTAFNHASNANNITNTSIVLVTFPLLNIRNPGEDEDFICPDGQAIPLPEGFSVAPQTTAFLLKSSNCQTFCWKRNVIERHFFHLSKSTSILSRKLSRMVWEPTSQF